MKRPANTEALTVANTVPMLDVNRGNHPLAVEFQTAIDSVFKTGRFLHGPEVQQLEKSVAGCCGTKHAIGCASGSDALLLSLMALEIGSGDEVIVPSFTFFATASAVWRLGARPVFVDIDPQTFNMDPRGIEQAITKATKAIIPVHLFGQMAPMDEIMQIAEAYHLRVIEDAAQSIAAAYQGRSAGSIGDVGCLSFYPTKNLGAFGDAGMITTNQDELADRLRLLAAHGMQSTYYHNEVGINSRLDSIQAAVLNVKISQLNKITAARRANAARYAELFSEINAISEIQLPETVDDAFHVWNQYTIRIAQGRRDELRSYLQQHGIGTGVYYPVPLHQQKCFASLDLPSWGLPETERAAGEVLSLPIFPELTVQEQQLVVAALADFYAKSEKSAA